MRFDRRQYLELMTFGEWERPMFVELFGLLVGLDEEWKNQGASQSEIELSAFDWDYVPVVPCGGQTGVKSDKDRSVIEETPEYIIQIDELGRRIKLNKGYSTLPLPLDFPVKDMNSWRQVKKYFAFTDDRIDWDAVELAKQKQAEGYLVVANIPGGFDTPRELMGEETACLAYYSQPELMHDILDTLTDTALKVFARITERISIDQLSVHEDLAGKNGPLIGPGQIEEFIKPYFTYVWELLSSRGTELFDMDSDGNILPILDTLLECGINSIHPFEPRAGMDIVEIRKKYGDRLAIRGGIDKFVLRQGIESIEKELEYKMQPLMVASGGIAFGLDHRILNQTPIENYRYYVNLGREILKLPLLDGSRQGWGRMAF